MDGAAGNNYHRSFDGEISFRFSRRSVENVSGNTLVRAVEGDHFGPTIGEDRGPGSFGVRDVGDVDRQLCVEGASESACSGFHAIARVSAVALCAVAERPGTVENNAIVRVVVAVRLGMNIEVLFNSLKVRLEVFRRNSLNSLLRPCIENELRSAKRSCPIDCGAPAETTALKDRNSKVVRRLPCPLLIEVLVGGFLGSVKIQGRVGSSLFDKNHLPACFCEYFGSRTAAAPRADNAHVSRLTKGFGDIGRLIDHVKRKRET